MAMGSRVVGLAVLLAPGAAWAQDLEFSFYDPNADGVPDFVLDSTDVSTWSRSGTGSPTVAWDGTQYVMFFESRFSNSFIDSLGAPGAYEGCRNQTTADRVVWGIGRATSPDGINWTADPGPVLIPQEGTFYHCQAAQPNVVYDPDTKTWHLYFKSLQVWEKFLKKDGTDTWGPARFTGVGYATSTDGKTFTVPSANPTLVIDKDLGFPSVMAVRPDGEEQLLWYMLVGLTPNIVMATAEDPAGPFTFYTAPMGTEIVNVLQPGEAKWTEDVVFNPAVTCDASATFPYAMFPGGRDTEPADFTKIFSAGVGRATSTDPFLDLAEEFSGWFVSSDSPYFEWTGGSEWRHWSATRIGTDDYVLYFSERTADQTLRISFVYTMDSATWSSADFQPRVCLGELPDTGDTGDTDTGDTDTGDTDTGDTDSGDTGDTDSGDTGDTGETDDPGETDDDTGGTRRGCRCDGTEGGATVFGLFGLALFGLVRRRRA